MTSLVPFKLGLKLMGLGFLLSKNLRKEIFNPEFGYIFNKTIQITTRSGDASLYIRYHNGRISSGEGKVDKPDLTLVFRNKKMMAESFTKSAEYSLDLLLSGDLYYIGNLSYLGKFSYLTTIFPKKAKKTLSKNFPPPSKVTEEQASIKKLQYEILDKKVDKVSYLEDPYLGRYDISNFPTIMKMKNGWFSEHAWVCGERAKNITDFHREYGFEVDKDGKPFHPNLRQGMAINYLLTHKTPIIWEDDLLPGTTTSKRLGVQIYPEMGGTGIWSELETMQSRFLNPYHIDDETRKCLNYYVFPYWMDRNIREKARELFGNPLCQRLEEYFCLYFAWKTQAISHTIPDFEQVFKLGLQTMIKRLDDKILSESNLDKKNTYQGMKLALEGVSIYARNLKTEAERQINQLKTQNDDSNNKNIRTRNLEKIIDSLNRIPDQPAQSYRDAITALWIIWLSLHQESMNAGLSLGRLDQILYPYFLKDMDNCKSELERKEKIEEIIELTSAFYLKCQDHLPMVPNVGNKLFGGSSSDQAVTLGGVTPDGDNAVNDLTYIFLKVTEMLGFRDPNVNARYHPEKNSIEYLRRLCEVNINTTSTPSIHNDKDMIESLVAHGFKLEDARNWGATGCVEPTSIGKHFGHTNCMMFNMIAPLEILINNGFHPLIHQKINSLTKDYSSANYPTFDSLFESYKTQLKFLVDQSVEYNNNLGKTHQLVHPTPLLSAIFQGPLDKGLDLTQGGAIYNSSGSALIGLPDIVDSLISLKKIVYVQKLVTLEEFRAAMARDFKGENDKILLESIKKIPKFGSDNPETNNLAKELVDLSYELFHSHKNYRGGQYFVGYWSMSNHVAFGKLSGTLPSGRLRGKAFVPGITPSPGSSDQLLENIKSVAKIDAIKTPNNIAFNVKLVPDVKDSHSQALDNFLAYTRSYFDLGGLQMQFNVVTTAMLKDAMVHPENYRWLMVRISGYNAYFTTLNRDMQIELIERMEFKA